MKLYAGTTQQFRADAQLHRIAEKLQAEYTTQLGHKPAPSEVHAWQNSLMALSMLVDQAELNDHGVILEYQLGNTSRRLDAMLTGHAATSAENAVVVELKQWSGESIGASTADNCVELYVGKQVRRVLHPSVQVGGYQQWLLDNHSVFYEADAVALTAVSYLHNLQFDPTGELWADRHAEALHKNPLYTGDHSAELAEFLDHHLSAGDGATVMSRVLESRYRPSRKLLDHTAAMIKAQSDFVLLDEQRVAFESVLAEARDGFHHAKKSVVLVQGGPGTGKSIIALHLVGELAKRGYNAMHATGSKAFTENMRRVVGSRAGQSQFRYFNQFGNADANDVDVLILDEAHRLRETSASRFTPKAKTHRYPTSRRAHQGREDDRLLHRRPPGRPPERGRQHPAHPRCRRAQRRRRQQLRARDPVPPRRLKGLPPVGRRHARHRAEQSNPPGIPTARRSTSASSTQSSSWTP